jgi:hypothetical protein
LSLTEVLHTLSNGVEEKRGQAPVIQPPRTLQEKLVQVQGVTRREMILEREEIEPKHKNIRIRGIEPRAAAHYMDSQVGMRGGNVSRYTISD